MNLKNHNSAARPLKWVGKEVNQEATFKLRLKSEETVHRRQERFKMEGARAKAAGRNEFKRRRVCRKLRTPVLTPAPPLSPVCLFRHLPVSSFQSIDWLSHLPSMPCQRGNVCVKSWSHLSESHGTVTVQLFLSLPTWKQSIQLPAPQHMPELQWRTRTNQRQSHHLLGILNLGAYDNSRMPRTSQLIKRPGLNLGIWHVSTRDLRKRWS